MNIQPSPASSAPARGSRRGAADPCRIVLVVPEFPQASETFLAAKFAGLLRRGWDAHVACLDSRESNWRLFPPLQQDRSLRRRVHKAWPSVTLRLLRIGSIGMATGNIFGSNVMNLTIIAIVDLFYQGSLYATITTAQLVTLGTGILMTGLFLSGAQIKAEKETRLHLDNIIILVLYLWIYYWLYRH